MSWAEKVIRSARRQERWNFIGVNVELICATLLLILGPRTWSDWAFVVFFYLMAVWCFVDWRKGRRTRQQLEVWLRDHR